MLPASVQLWMRDIRGAPEVEHITLQAKAIPTIMTGSAITVCSGSIKGRSPVLAVGSGLGNSQQPLPVPMNPKLEQTTVTPEEDYLDKSGFISAQMEQSVLPVTRTLKQLDEMRSNKTGENVATAAGDRFYDRCAKFSEQLTDMCNDFDKLLYFPRCNRYAHKSVTAGRELVAGIRQQAATLTSLRYRVTRNLSGPTSRNQSELLPVISHLHGRFVEHIVLMDCEMLVQALDQSKNKVGFMRTVTAISGFADRGNHVRRLFCKAGAVVSLLRSDFPFDDTESVRVVALRCLANVSCHPDSLLSLEKDSNFQKLIAMIWINANSNAIRCETAGVLAQIAAHLQPTKRKSDEVTAAAATLLDSLIDALPAVVRALVYVTKHVKDEETLLVVAACIANLSLLHSVTPVLELVCQQDCMSSLLLAWRNGYAATLFTKNQITGAVLGLSMQSFGQDYLMTQPSLAEFFIDVLNQCLPEKSLAEAEIAVRNRVVRRSLIILGCLLKRDKFRSIFLKSQGIIIYQKVLGFANRETTPRSFHNVK
ncbi:hypothetical protein BV898_08367 [Hypsibius exemplaris]|uniref:Protein inscuteable homologue C-terminal domain-containing protein n=1 Tax=Hypsibius exemplaris TaxID=2072580 RepID=A0A1W0WQW4_HYPEX|nr:hypothetical protein BV898_08367 [Hypsibius exemplaris]